MKASSSRWLKRVFFLILIPFLLSIQNRGEYSFESLDANNIMNMNTMEFGSKSSAFLSGIGGVSFDQVAKPGQNLKINSLKISYHPEIADGKRLQITINDHTVHVALNDWLLLPIAKYAASPYYSCYTLFGKLKNKKIEKMILENEGRVMNYHPDLANTLLGLRISDLDILIVYNFTSDLPKDEKGYILGKDEIPPDIQANQMAMNEVYYLMNALQGKYQKKHRSYVITDYTRDIVFDTRADSLNISGSLYYFCWRYKQDQPGYDINVFSKKLNESYQQLIAQKRKADPSFDVQALAIDSLLQTAKRYDGNYSFYDSGTFNDLLNIKTGDEDRKVFLRKYDANSIFNMILETESYMDAQSVDYLEDYSKELSGNTEKLRALNPTVWDAATSMMRYAAFFRYVKVNFPAEWKSFMEEIASIKTKPELLTPTVMYPTNNKLLEKTIRENKTRQK